MDKAVYSVQWQASSCRYGRKEIGEFLTYLATKRTHFPLQTPPLAKIDGIVRAKKPRHLPERFTKEEVSSPGPTDRTKLADGQFALRSRVETHGVPHAPGQRYLLGFGCSSFVTPKSNKTGWITLLPEKLIIPLEKHLVKVNDITAWIWLRGPGINA